MMQRNTSTFLRASAVGLLAGVAASATLVVGVIVRACLDAHWSVAALWAVGLMALAVPLSMAARKIMGVWGPTACAVALLFNVPIFFFGALWALTRNIVESHVLCGTGDVALVITPVVVIGFCVVGGVAAAVALAWLRRPLVWMLRIVPWLLLAGAAGLLTVAIPRSLERPDPDSYVSSLPVVARLPAVDRDNAEHGADEATAGGVRVRRQCSLDNCFLELARVDAPPSIFLAEGFEGASIAGSQPLVIRRDAARGWNVVEADGEGVLAFRDESRFPQSITVVDMAPALSAPIGWVLGGAAGVLFALVLLVSTLRKPKELAWIAAARAGQVGGDGRSLRFDDGELPGRASITGFLPDGPALAAPLAGEAQPPTYRADGSCGAWQAMAGTRERLIEEAYAAYHGRRAFALALLASTVAPLLAARSVGLL